MDYKYEQARMTCMADFIVQSAVKEQLADRNVSSNFYDALDGEVEELLADAAQRAADNDRKTVQPRDL
jgi:histone H3/H4